MQRRGRRPMAKALGLALAAALAATGSPAQQTASSLVEDARPPSSLLIIQEAFDRRYEVDLVLDIELVMSDGDGGGGEHRRVFRAASKRIDDRMHSIGRIQWPNHLRGMTILTIEAKNRGHDSFVYMPTLGKVRRVSTAQRSDSFLGSDVTYEDLERRHPEDFVPETIGSVELDGEAAWEIGATPNYNANYERLTFLIAKADLAILEARYFKWGKQIPYRTVKSRRAGILSGDGYAIPTHFLIKNSLTRTTTEVTFSNVVVNADLDDRTFSVTTLERDHNMPIEVRKAPLEAR